MIDAQHTHTHALYAYSNAHPDHCPNMDAQHEQMIYHLEYVIYCVIVPKIDVKLYKFNMLKKYGNILQHDLIYFYTYVVDYDMFFYYVMCHCIYHTYNVHALVSISLCKRVNIRRPHPNFYIDEFTSTRGPV